MKLLLLLVLFFQGVSQSHTYCTRALIDSPFVVKIYPGSSEVVYVFPGLGENLNAWERKRSLAHPLKAHWQNSGISTPTILLVVSPKPRFFSTRRTSITEPGEITLNKILAIEKQLPFQVTRRSALGISLGAYNLMYLTLLQPKLFEKIALVVPPFVEMDIRHHTADYLKWAIRTASRRTDLHWTKRIALGGFLMSLPPLIRPAFANVPILNYFTDISKLFQDEYRWEHFPKIYLSAARNDEFNFFDGAEKFYRLGTTTGLQMHWHPLEGNHQGPFDSESIAKFLVE